MANSLDQVLFLFSSLGCLLLTLAFSLASYTTRRAQHLSLQSGELPDGRPWPKLSVVVPACDEAETIEPALKSLLSSTYPDFEVLIVNDRSRDETGEIIGRIAGGDPRVQAITIEELPDGWLGKVHAMHQATARATGEFLLYTDADVHFGVGALERAVVWMETKQLGHLALIPKIMSRGLLYNAAISCFAVLYLAAVKGWRIGEAGSEAYGGVGAFSMVRRSDFERTGGWEWLKMEVADDVGLGMMMVRQTQAVSALGVAPDLLQVDWYPSVSGLIRGLSKNAFGAMCGYSPTRVIGVLLLSITMLVGPITALTSDSPVLHALAGVSLGSLVLLAHHFRRIRQPVLATLLAPLGLAVLGWTLLASMITTLGQRGIVWRDRFYPLDALRAGRRVDL